MSPSLQADRPRLMLASGSAARRALLAAAGLRVSVQPVALDEAALRDADRAAGVPPDDAAMRLAELKAAGVPDPGALVIGADQILVCDGVWHAKPSDPDAAREQLRRLRGRTHTLHTAVACRQDGATIWRHLARPRLTMRDFSDEFLDAYLRAEGEQVTATVGGYRLEGPGLQLFAHVEGEHAAILGLPMLALIEFLRRRGVLLA